jgi:hypothetical protein
MSSSSNEVWVPPVHRVPDELGEVDFGNYSSSSCMSNDLSTTEGPVHSVLLSGPVQMQREDDIDLVAGQSLYRMASANTFTSPALQASEEGMQAARVDSSEFISSVPVVLARSLTAHTEQFDMSIQKATDQAEFMVERMVDLDRRRLVEEEKEVALLMELRATMGRSAKRQREPKV